MPTRRAMRRAAWRAIGWRTRPRQMYVFTAAVTRPRSSSASNTVVTRGDMCSRLRLTITSSTICFVPSASVARNDDPYSTNRPSSRWYQVMLGMRVPTGCSPVIRADRHTGVSDGNVETHASVRLPSSWSRARAGALPAAIARSSTAGPRPSITARISFLGIRSRGVGPASAQDAEALVLLLIAAAGAVEQHSRADREDVADDRDGADEGRDDARAVLDDGRAAHVAAAADGADAHLTERERGGHHGAEREADVGNLLAGDQLERQSTADHAPHQLRAGLRTRPDRVGDELDRSQRPEEGDRRGVVGDVDGAVGEPERRDGRADGQRRRGEEARGHGQPEALAERDDEIHGAGS